MGHGLRAVLFDFDGVMVNSEPLHFYAFHEVLKAEHIELTEEEYYREVIGFDDKGAFRHIYQMRGLTLEPKVFLKLLTRKSEVMMELIQQRRYSALPGVNEFVRSLWRTYPLAICTGALREEVEVMLEGISLRDCFKVIVSAEDVTRGKPDPQGYLLTAEKLSHKAGQELKPSDCLVIEDAPTVIRRAKAAGFKTLAVATTYPLEKLGDADYSVQSLRPEDVKKKITGLKIML
jgi:HAD superfamily hydrolase (TIGR01509 family)